MLEVYVWFAMWSYSLLWGYAFCNPTKFRRHVSIQAAVISIYQKFNMAMAAILDL